MTRQEFEAEAARRFEAESDCDILSDKAASIAAELFAEVTRCASCKGDGNDHPLDGGEGFGYCLACGGTGSRLR